MITYENIITNLNETKPHLCVLCFWQYIYVLCNPEGGMQLYQFIIIFGTLMLILAQIPSFHSLRHINLISLTLSLAYSACVTAASLKLGKKNNFVSIFSNSFFFCKITNKAFPWQGFPRMPLQETTLLKGRPSVSYLMPSMAFQ